MRAVLVLLAMVCGAVAVAVPVRADPPVAVEGVSQNGKINFRWPLARTPGVVARFSEITVGPDTDPICPSPSSVIWATYKRPTVFGDNVYIEPPFGTLALDILHPGQARYAISTWPVIPVSFAGLFGEGDSHCVSTALSGVSFVAPAANTYRVRFELSQGSLVASVHRIDLASQEFPNWPVADEVGHEVVATQTLLSTVTVRRYLPQGVYRIGLGPGAQGATKWTVTVDDEAPKFAYLRLRKSGGLVHVEFRMSESGRVNLDLLRGQTVVRRILVNKKIGVNNRSYAWDGRLANDTPAPSGTYTIRVAFTDWRGRVAVSAAQYAVQTG